MISDNEYFCLFRNIAGISDKAGAKQLASIWGKTYPKKDLQLADIKEMQAEQVKTSVETSKEVQTDPKLKTKAEKDRRLKEKQAANTKRFMDERKNIGIKNNKAKTKLKAAHSKQLEDLSKWIKTRIAMLSEEEGEYKLANKREAFV